MFGDIRMRTLLRAYREYNTIRVKSGEEELVAPVGKMNFNDLYWFLLDYIDFVDEKGDRVGASPNREEKEKWVYVVPPEFQHIGDNFIKRQALDDALDKFNEFNEKSGEPELVVPKDIKQVTRSYYDFLTQFIIFANEKGGV